MDAAWAALTTGQPGELRALESLLDALPERPVEAGSAVRADGLELQTSVRRLELLLAATERNLRILRGQCRM